MFAALLVSAVTLIPSPIPASFHPTHFEITSAWRDLELELPMPPQTHGSVAITCHYLDRYWHCSGGWIENGWVTRLLDAARIPDEPGQVRLAGYSDTDVANIAGALQTEILNTPYWNASQRRAALSLATPAKVRAKIHAMFSPDPNLSHANTVIVRLRDDANHIVVIESENAHGKMLPWRLSYDGRSVTFAHASISNAVAALLPAGETNRSQLMQEMPNPGDMLLTEIDFRVIACMYNEDPSDSKFCALTREKQ